MQNRSGSRRYAVFLSYRHADNKEQGRQWATWLHQALEGYEIPSDLVGTKNSKADSIPASLYPVFRDEEELPADADLTRTIRQALESSDVLVVLCSPRAVESRFVAEEIRYFKELGKADRILALIIDGEPNASDDSGKAKSGIRPESECLPEPLRYGVARLDGNIDWSQQTEQPIAADTRPEGKPEQGWTTGAAYREALQKSGKYREKEITPKVREYEERLNLAKLKVVAGALGLPLGVLTQRDKVMQLKRARERARRARRIAATFAGLALIAAFAAALAFFEQKNAERRLYFSDMLLAGRGLSEGRPSDARLRLDRHQRERSTRDLRGWEWFLLYGQAIGDQLRVNAHQGGANSLSVTNDGRFVATIGEDGTVAIWETPALKERARWRAHNERGLRVAWDATGGRLATASGSGSVKVWEAASDLTTWKLVAQFVLPKAENGDAVETIAWEPLAGAKARLAIGGRHPEIRLWQPDSDPSGANTKILYNSHNGVAAVCWSSDARRIAAALLGTDRVNVVIDVATGEQIAGWPAPSGNDSFCIAFDSKNERLAAGSKHQFVTAYSLMNGKTLLEHPVHKGFVTSVAWEPDGDRIASASYDGTITISDVTGERPTEVLSGHKGNVHAAAWVTVPIGKVTRTVIFSCASDGTLRAWQGTKTKSEVLARRLGWISGARFSPDNRNIAVTTFNGSPMSRLRIFDTVTGDGRIVPVPEAMPFDVAWAPKGDKLAIGQMHTDRVSVIDLAGNEFSHFHHKGAWRVAWHPDGRHLAVGSLDGVAVFDTQCGDSCPILSIHRSGGRIAWNRDGRRLAIGTYEGAVEVWNGLAGTLDAALRQAPSPVPGEIYVGNEPPRKVSDIQWDPVGDRVAFVTENTVAEIIDARSGELPRQFFGHTGGIKCLAWSPNGKRIATGGADGTVRLYSVETGDELCRIPHGTESNEISSLDWSTDGSRLVSAGFDGYVMIWDARRGQNLAARKVMLKRLKKDPNNRTLLIDAARLCAKTGSASTARALLDRLNAGNADRASLSEEIETTLASLLTAE